jgi:hypothetical protein
MILLLNTLLLNWSFLMHVLLVYVQVQYGAVGFIQSAQHGSLLVFGNNHSNVVSHCPCLNGWLGGDLSLVLSLA